MKFEVSNYTHYEDMKSAVNVMSVAVVYGMGV